MCHTTHCASLQLTALCEVAPGMAWCHRIQRCVRSLVTGVGTNGGPPSRTVTPAHQQLPAHELPCCLAAATPATPSRVAGSSHIDRALVCGTAILGGRAPGTRMGIARLSHTKVDSRHRHAAGAMAALLLAGRAIALPSPAGWHDAA